MLKGKKRSLKSKISTLKNQGKSLTDLNEFKSTSDVIIANRLSEDILDVKDNVYMRIGAIATH